MKKPFLERFRAKTGLFTKITRKSVDNELMILRQSYQDL